MFGSSVSQSNHTLNVPHTYRDMTKLLKIVNTAQYTYCIPQILCRVCQYAHRLNVFFSLLFRSVFNLLLIFYVMRWSDTVALCACVCILFGCDCMCMVKQKCDTPTFYQQRRLMRQSSTSKIEWNAQRTMLIL